MFFKLTPEKVVARINRVIDNLGSFDARIREYEDEAALAISLGIARPGDDSEIKEWRAVYDGIYETLAEARYAIGTGQADFVEINKMIGPVKSSVKNFKRVLDETDRIKAAGEQAAKQYFRKLNAPNP